MPPLLKCYDVITFDTLADYTKPAIIKVYRARCKKVWSIKEKKKENHLDKGEMLFEFQYEPLLKITEYEKLLTEYEMSTTLKKLYNVALQFYRFIYCDGVKWFVEKSKSSFDVNTELEKYKYKLDDGFACPILKHLDNRFWNTNIYQHIRNLMMESEGKNIRSVNKLLYKPKTESNLSKFKYTNSGFLLFNAIANIAYFRFSLFLKERQSVKTNKEYYSPKAFEDIFLDKKDFTFAVDALRKIKVINNNNENLIGRKLKGVMQVWINILRTKLKTINDETLTILLNQQFKYLNLSEKTEGKHFRNAINKKASNLYEATLLLLLDN